MPATRGNGLFQCGSCQRQYKRPDHLTRHVRSHLDSKPHQCHLCQKAFTRIDLLKRHIAAHEAKGDHLNPSLSEGSSSSLSRVSQACQSCAANHLRCTETKPCRRCVSKGIECVSSRPLDAENAFTPPETVPQQSTRSPDISLQDSGGKDLNATTYQENSLQEDLLSDLDVTQAITNDFIEVRSFPKHPDMLFVSGTSTPFGPFNFDPDMSMELDDIDLRFLDSYNVNIPFGADEYTPTPSNIFSMGEGAGSTPKSICTDAYRTSHWSFRPGVNDHGGAEEENLILTDDGHNPPEKRVPVETRITSASLATAGRDKLITTIMRSCRTDSLFKAAASFPSINLLDSLLQFYFSSPSSEARYFLHAPTFDPNKKRSELIMAMVAHGAVLTLDPTFLKLGFAMQESARVAIPTLWEGKNALIRDLQLTQAFYITLEIGLWSGHSRKVEIAESFLQPILTMLRRGGRFKNSSYPDISLSQNTRGEELEETWTEWVEQESFKRICFRILRHDSNSSASLLTNPLISYAELKLPLPASDKLWSAPTAERWKEAFLAEILESPPAIGAYLEDPRLFATITNRNDLLSRSHAFLSCIWSMAWEYIQLNSMQRTAPGRWSGIVLKSRQDELLKLLEHFRLSTEPGVAFAPDVTMRTEQILLHLYISIEDVQVFAGIEGPERSSAIYPIIKDWAKGESARRAVWHAGQILRAARLIPKEQIRDSLAIMMYHASLALWVYGVACEDHPRDTLRSPRSSSGREVILDGTDGVHVQRFMQLGNGVPCIQIPSADATAYASSTSNVPLACHETVMDTVVTHLHANYPGEGRPLLVDEIIQIMVGLRNSDKSLVDRSLA
ncbi:unnamed protein product [Clonostachys byssicola]|uniref:Uncharacterized protein n=1 Tax=Clonostachys byssicola TaxID=160290 RepID=A0A9N9Y0U4_9HYPO|nr:unnamed protein product [Clonostachys byssicola]